MAEGGRSRTPSRVKRSTSTLFGGETPGSFLEGQFRVVNVVENGHTVNTLALDPERDELFTGDAAGQVRCWTASTAEEKTPYTPKEAQVKPGKNVYCSALDSHQLITGHEDASVRVFNRTTGACDMLLTGHRGWVTAVDFLDVTLFSGSRDKSVLEWDLEKGVEVRVLEGSKDVVRVVRAARRSVLVAGYDRMLRLFDRRTGKEARVFSGHTQGVWCAQMDDKKVISGSTDTTIKIWDVSTGQVLRTLTGHQGGVLTLQYDEEKLVSGSDDGTIKVWDMNSTEPAKSIRAYDRWVRALAFSPAGMLVTASDDGMIRTWECITKRSITPFRRSTSRLGLGGKK